MATVLDEHICTWVFEKTACGIKATDVRHVFFGGGDDFRDKLAGGDFFNMLVFRIESGTCGDASTYTEKEQALCFWINHQRQIGLKFLLHVCARGA